MDITHSSAPTRGRSIAVPTSRTLVVAVVALFFLWGGITSLNDILIPKLKGMLSLSYTEAMLTQFAFFTAYFIVSLPAGSLVARVGYLGGIVIGLGIMSAGCLMFIPASSSGVYALFLSALFVLAAGISVLQVAANPLIANLGNPATASSRLTLAQAFNSLGTTIFPPVGGVVILGSMANVEPSRLPEPERLAFLEREGQVIADAYLGIAIVLGLMALFFWSKRSLLATERGSTVGLGGSLRLLRRPRLGGGVAAIFLYVGAEVTIGSMMINYLAQPTVLGLGEQQAARLLALYWGGAMVGRFAGAAILRRFNPGQVLAAFCLGAAALLILSATSSGLLAGYALMAIGLMNSIMFPTIFSLSVEGLGEDTPKGSGLVCMGIVGGAVVPLIFGAVADASSLTLALVVPLACYLLISVFGMFAAKHPLDQVVNT